MHSSQGHTIPERYKSPAPTLWRSGTGFTTQSKWYWAEAPAPPRTNPRTGLSDSHRLWNQDSIELMRTNTTREKLAKGEVVYGCGLQVYRAPEIPRAFAAAGFDY